MVKVILQTVLFLILLSKPAEQHWVEVAQFNQYNKYN